MVAGDLAQRSGYKGDYVNFKEIITPLAQKMRKVPVNYTPVGGYFVGVWVG